MSDEYFLKDFEGLTNNQAYQLAFNKIMLRPMPGQSGRFLGTSQRDDFQGTLRKLVSELPSNGSVLDVGAGAGEVVEFAFRDSVPLTFHLEEPNPILLERYVERLNGVAHLSLGQTHQGALQSLYGPEGAAFTKKLAGQQDLILMIHMIYHLTDFSQDQIDPEGDLVDAFRYLVPLLANDQKIFVVYADQTRSTTGQAGAYFFDRRSDGKKILRNLENIWNARNSLLRDGTLVEKLGDVSVRSETVDSKVYGKNLDETAAICLTGELGGADGSPFDMERISSSLEFLEKYGAQKAGLKKTNETGARAGFYEASQPQVITIVERKS